MPGEYKELCDRVESMESKIDDIHVFIKGDVKGEHVGAQYRITNLEKAEKERTFWGRTINISVLSLAIKSIWDTITGR